MEAFATCDFNNMVRVFIVLAAVLAVAYGFKIPFPKHVNERIVYGSEIDIRQVPYQASLRRNKGHTCGASIISDKWAVTAAHCFKDGPSVHWTLYVGSSDRNERGTVHEISQMIIHPEYKSSDLDYDIMVLQVETPFEFGDSVQSVPLADANPAADTKVLTSGWGDLYYQGNAPQHLRGVVLLALSEDICKEKYGSLITDNMICAGILGTNKGVCQGDSGGPLLSETNHLVGITSFSGKCGDPNVPDVFASVANLRSWIRENTGV